MDPNQSESQDPFEETPGRQLLEQLVSRKKFTKLYRCWEKVREEAKIKEILVDKTFHHSLAFIYGDPFPASLGITW